MGGRWRRRRGWVVVGGLGAVPSVVSGAGWLVAVREWRQGCPAFFVTVAALDTVLGLGDRSRCTASSARTLGGQVDAGAVGLSVPVSPLATRRRVSVPVAVVVLGYGRHGALFERTEPATPATGRDRQTGTRRGDFMRVGRENADMDCIECEGETTAFVVPAELREFLPENAGAAALCTSCLTLQPPAPNETRHEEPDLTRVSEAFPEDPAAAVPMALAVGLLDSLALNRPKIERLLERVEERGTDPLLVLDRLAEDPALAPAMDLTGRRRQLEQLMQ
jgi:hypothetical protein